MQASKRSVLNYARIIASVGIGISLLNIAWSMGWAEVLILAEAMFLLFLAGGITSYWEYGDTKPWPWMRSWNFLLLGELGLIGYSKLVYIWIRVPGWLSKYGIMSDCHAHILFVVGGTLLMSLIVTMFLWIVKQNWSCLKGGVIFILAVITLAAVFLKSSPNTLKYVVDHPWPWEWELCD